MTKTDKVVRRRALDAQVDNRPVIVQVGPGDKLTLRLLGLRKGGVTHKLLDLLEEGETSPDLTRRVTRRTVNTYFTAGKQKKIAVQIGPGDIIKFRYEGEREWMETSIPGAMQHAAAQKADRDKVQKKLDRGHKIYANRGALQR